MCDFFFLPKSVAITNVFIYAFTFILISPSLHVSENVFYEFLRKKKKNCTKLNHAFTSWVVFN